MLLFDAAGCGNQEKVIKYAKKGVNLDCCIAEVMVGVGGYHLYACDDARSKSCGCCPSPSVQHGNNTPLLNAAEKGHTSVVNILTERNACVDSINKV